jgi:hypothetical protein
MIWEIYQQKKIAEAKQTANDAKAKASGQAHNIAGIDHKLEMLALTCQAMWELLRDHSDLTEEDIEQKVLEIDGRDGKIDGRMGAQTLDCPSCGRPTNSRRASCVICGAELSKLHKFEV